MHKIFLSKNNEYIKFITTLSQKKLQKQNIDIYTFQNFLTDYKEIQDVAFTISLFEREKCIIIENCQFLLANQSISDEAKDVFLQLIAHKPTHLILTVNNDKLDERKKITKVLRESIEVSIMKDDSRTAVQLLNAYIKQENIIIEPAVIQQLLIQSHSNLFHCISELKRFTVQYKTKNFTNIHIPEIQKIPDEDIFFFGEYIVKNEYLKLFNSLRTWTTLHPNSADFQRVMRYLYNHAKLVYQVLHLTRKHYSQTEIAKLLNIHEYRIKLLIPHMKNVQEQQLKQFINTIIDGDYMMKSGIMNRMLYMEMMYQVTNHSS